MLEHLVEDLGGVELGAQCSRHREHHRPEDLAEPPLGDELLVVGARLDRRRVGVEVVEQPAGLVLLDVEAGEPQQPAGVVPGVHDLGADADEVAGDAGHDVELGDVEAEVVELADARVDPEALAGGHQLVLGQGRPQRPVAPHDGVAGVDRVDARLEQLALLQVHELADGVGARHVEVVAPLPVATASRTARRSRRRRGRRRTSRRRGGTACWTASSRPSRSRPGAGGRAAPPARPAAGPRWAGAASG